MAPVSLGRLLAETLPGNTGTATSPTATSQEGSAPYKSAPAKNTGDPPVPPCSPNPHDRRKGKTKKGKRSKHALGPNVDTPLIVASTQDSHTQGVDDASRDQSPVEQEPPKVHKKRKRSRHRPHSSTEVSHSQGDDDVTRQAALPPGLTSTEVSHSQGDDDVTRQAAEPPALTLDPDEQPLVEQEPAKIHSKRKRSRHRPHSSTEVSHTQGDDDVTRQAAQPPALTSTEVSHSQGDDDVQGRQLSRQPLQAQKSLTVREMMT